jgi:thioredoxin reductase (NADPH)
MLLLPALLLLRTAFCDDPDEDDEPGFGWMDEEDFAPTEINWSSVSVREVIILGSGPAGSTAALYLARSGQRPLVLHGPIPNGQLTYTSDIENYPGFVGTGPNLVKFMQAQAENASAIYKQDIILSVNLSVFPYELSSDQNGYKTRSLIIATGAEAKYLGLPSEERLKTRGVSACAVCDGALFTDQPVAVVGGGDTAIEEAIYLTNMCKSVHLIHRRSEMRASRPMQEKLARSKVHVIWDTVITDVIGEDSVTGLQIKNVKTGETTVIGVRALFVAIGRIPATGLFRGQLDLDADGYFVTNGTPQTTVPGVFVAGDCADKVFRQAITSAGTGCQAALLAERYLSTLNE